MVCGKENERRRDGFLIKVSIPKRKGETESHCITLHAKWLMEKKREKNTRVFLVFIEVSLKSHPREKEELGLSEMKEEHEKKKSWVED